MPPHTNENRDSMSTTEIAGLKVATVLKDFIEAEALPGTGVAPEVFWSAFAELDRRFGPKNTALLKRREELQAQIDDWLEPTVQTEE